MVMSLVGKLMMSAARWLALPVLAGVIGFAIALQSQSGGDPASFSKEVSGSDAALKSRGNLCFFEDVGVAGFFAV